MWVTYSQRITKAVGMTSSEVEGKDEFSRKVGFHQKKLLALGFWLNITADDDLIHNAHNGSLEMLILRVTNNCRQYVNSVACGALNMVFLLLIEKCEY